MKKVTFMNDSTDESDMVDEQSESFALCHELELAVLPPIHMEKWVQLVRKVKQTPYTKILSTAGHWRIGAIITVAVSPSTPFLDIVMQMPIVERLELGDAAGGYNSDYYWNLYPNLNNSGCERTRVYLTLKKEDSTSIN